MKDRGQQTRTWLYCGSMSAEDEHCLVKEGVLSNSRASSGIYQDAEV